MPNNDNNKGVSPVEIQKFLAGIKYPTNKNNLVSYARQHNASEDVINMLDKLPEDQYGGPQDVSKAVGEME